MEGGGACQRGGELPDPGSVQGRLIKSPSRHFTPPPPNPHLWRKGGTRARQEGMAGILSILELPSPTLRSPPPLPFPLPTGRHQPGPSSHCPLPSALRLLPQLASDGPSFLPQSVAAFSTADYVLLELSLPSAFGTPPPLEIPGFLGGRGEALSWQVCSPIPSLFRASPLGPAPRSQVSKPPAALPRLKHLHSLPTPPPQQFLLLLDGRPRIRLLPPILRPPGAPQIPASPQQVPSAYGLNTFKPHTSCHLLTQPQFPALRRAQAAS